MGQIIADGPAADYGYYPDTEMWAVDGHAFAMETTQYYDGEK